MATIKKIPLAKLVEDFDIYPRNHVDATHVGDLVRAIQSGQELPPIVVDAMRGGVRRGTAG